MKVCLRTMWLLCALSVGFPAVGEEKAEPVTIGSQRQLFVDRLLIDSMKGAEVRLQVPHDEGIAIKFDNPWEGLFCGYVTMIQDGEKLRAYYRGMPTAGSDGSPNECTCVAESVDGIHWTKPELNLYEMNGVKPNNVVLAQSAPFTHNFCPMLDRKPGVAADQRYKALGGTAASGLFAFVSADGLSWKKMFESAVIKEGAFDSQNVPFWSEADGKYWCYFRVFKDGIRRIARTCSDDFEHWGPAELMEYSQGPLEHMYTNQTSPYFRAPQYHLAISARFFPERRVLSPEQAEKIKVHPNYFSDCSDAVLMSVRAGAGPVYERLFLDGFLKPGLGLENWVSRTNYPALNVLPTGEGRISFYVNQNYGQPTAHLRRYSLRTDGFTAVHTGAEGGELKTKGVTFSGKELMLNFATSAAGSVKVELQDEDRKAIPGFSAEECQEMIGSDLDRVVIWKGGSDVSKLAGKTVRIKFLMKDAELFAFRFE